MPLSQKTMSMVASPTVAASPPPRIERATAACMFKTAKTLYKPPSSVHAQAERLTQADAEALIHDHGAEAYGEARRRERDVILPDGTTHAGRTPAHWRRMALTVARMTGKRVGGRTPAHEF